MNIGKKYIINRLSILFLLVTLMFSLTPATVSKGVLNNTNYSKNSYIESIDLQKNISFSGVYDSYSWNFNVDKRTKVDSVKTVIIFEVTDVLQSNIGSYLTFLLNGTEFQSKKIESNNGQNQSVELEIPLELLKEGFNEFKVEAYLRVTDTPCTDDLNTTNWLVLKKDSKININKKNMIPQNLISEFPYPIVNGGGYETTKIIIPSNYTDSNLTAALKLQILIGREGGSAEIIKSEDIKNLEKSNIVFIGKFTEIPEKLKVNIVGIKNLEQQAYINIVNSPVGATGEEKAIYILSENDRELVNAVKFLMNEELVSQVNKGEVYITNEMDLNNIVKDDSKNFNFKDLGYTQKTVEGLFRNETYMNFKLPKNKILSDGDTLNINFRYSENLDFDRSLFTVFVNDVPIGSKKLEKSKSNGDSFEITIPKDVIDKSYFEIKFAFDLLLKDVNCEVRDQNQPWALILDDSTIQINDKEINQFYFDTYPAPFVSNWDINDTLIVLPDNIESKELASIGNMMAYMGKATKYNIGSFEAISSKNLGDEYKDRNIIVYGTPNNNNLIKDLSKNLWFEYSEDYTKFISNEKLTLMDDFAKTMTTFQLDVSPYNNQRNMLVLTSPREDLLEKSLVFLSSDKEFYKLSGDGAVIDEYGNVKCFKYKKEVKKPSYERIIESSNSLKFLLGIVVGLAIFIVIAIVLYSRKYKVKNDKNVK